MPVDSLSQSLYKTKSKKDTEPVYLTPLSSSQV